MEQTPGAIQIRHVVSVRAAIGRRNQLRNREPHTIHHEAAIAASAGPQRARLKRPADADHDRNSVRASSSSGNSRSVPASPTGNTQVSAPSR